MIVLDVLKRIFNNLFILYIIISLVVGMKKMVSNSPKESTESNDSDNVSNKSNWKDNVKLVIALSTLVLFIAVVMFIMDVGLLKNHRHRFYYRGTG